MGKYGAKTLMQHYVNQFGCVTSPDFKRAQRKFAESLAGYAVVCYLLSIKVIHTTHCLILLISIFMITNQCVYLCRIAIMEISSLIHREISSILTLDFF
jgi:hypothetical protein